MYKLFFKPLYDSLRLIFLRLMNRPTIELSEMNEDIGRNILNQLEKQRRNLERSDAENKAYRERVEYLTKLASSEDTVERARWRDRISQPSKCASCSPWRTMSTLARILQIRTRTWRSTSMRGWSPRTPKMVMTRSKLCLPCPVY